MANLSLRVLGPPSIDVDSAALTVDTRKAVALLTFVALEGAQRRESLAALLWPDSDDARARAALRRTLSVLNRALDGRHLDSGRTLVQLVGDDWWCDATAFRHAATRAGAHRHGPEALCADCLTALETAAALYRGDLLQGFTLRDSAAFDEWMLITGESLRRECSGVLERLVDELTHRGRLDEAATHAQRLLALDTLHEPAHRRLMQLHAWRGRRTDAIRQYRECVATLDRELGVPPLEETTAVYRAILEEKLPGPLAAAATPAPPPADAPSPAAHASTSSIAPDEVDRAGPDQPPLVGRGAALTTLRGGYAAAGATGRVLAVTGEAGIGKTRLAEELLHDLAADGSTIVAVRCHPGDRQLAYAPIAEALREATAGEHEPKWLDDAAAHARAEAARLVPAIAPAGARPPDEPLTSPGAQARFVEGVWQVLLAALAGERTGVLCVDDAQWADDATMQFLAYLVARLDRRRVVLLCCWRREDLGPGHPWHHVIADAADAGLATVVDLERLSVDDVATLLAASDRADDPAVARLLHREAEGLPLAVVSYLQELEPSVAGDWPPPRDLAHLFRKRVADLDDAAHQLLTAAATIGRSFDVDTVTAASGRTDGETVAALETLTARGMVRELDTPGGPPHLDFTHDKLRAVVYNATSAARRQLLHGRVADALRSRLRGDNPPFALAGRIAHHERLAGRQDRAAEMEAVAGEQARALYANREALDHMKRALALGHPDAARLHEAVGDLHKLAGDYRAAVTSYCSAVALHPPSSVPVATLEHKIARVHLRAGDTGAARTHLDAAEDALVEGAESGLRARITADRSLATARDGDTIDAERQARLALNIAERAGDRRALAQARNILGLLARRAGRLHDAEQQLEHSAALAGTLQQPDAQVTALNNLALVLGAAGRFDHALEHATTAVELCERIGDRHRQAALHNNIADLLHAAGREEEAMTHLTRAVTLFADIGAEPGREPEIWKLVDW